MFGKSHFPLDCGGEKGGEEDVTLLFKEKKTVLRYKVILPQGNDKLFYIHY